MVVLNSLASTGKSGNRKVVYCTLRSALYGAGRRLSYYKYWWLSHAWMWLAQDMLADRCSLDSNVTYPIQQVYISIYIVVMLGMHILTIIQLVRSIDYTATQCPQLRQHHHT
jgi:hypothetical protein